LLLTAKRLGFPNHANRLNVVLALQLFEWQAGMWRIGSEEVV
jgi:hypothetical protein